MICLLKKSDLDNYIANNYKENIEPYIESKGAQKMWNYFLYITKKDYFVNTIRELKQKYKIPLNGFKKEDDSYSIPLSESVFKYKYHKELRQDLIDKICIKYGLHQANYADVLLDFIYYNDGLHPLYEMNTCGLFRISDVIEEKKESFSDYFQQSDDISYPIAIRISPYASKRDLIDFIKNKVIWKLILFLQKKYKNKNIKIGKIKSRNKQIQERNEFIYNNRNKPLKEISKLLSEKGGNNKIYDIEIGHIAKIISLEEQKRKEV